MEKNIPLSSDSACAVRIQAKLVSLNGGVVLAIAMLVTAITAGSFLIGSSVMSQTFLFGLLTVFSWIYLIDSASETLALEHQEIIRTSFFGRRMAIPFRDVARLILKHEGLNSNVGIESLTVVYRNRSKQRIPLGPCWRKRDLEAFLASAERAMGNESGA